MRPLSRCFTVFLLLPAALAHEGPGKAERLRKVREPERWDALWNELSSTDKGRGDLQEELDTPFGDVSLSMEGLPQQIRRGEKVSFRLVAKNEGRRGVWLSQEAFKSCEWVAKRFSAGRVADPAPASSDPMQAAMGMLPQGGAGSAPAGGGANKDVPYLYLAPGETYSRGVEVKDLDFIGQVRFHLSYAGSSRSQDPLGPGGFQAMMRQIQQMQAGGGAGAAVQVSARPLQSELRVASGWIPVIAERSAGSAGLVLHHGKDRLIANPDLSIRVVLENTGRESPMIPKRVLKERADGFWFALLDAKGNIARIGALDGRDEKGRDAPRAVLSPGEKLEATGFVRPSVPPGKYKLLCGFSAHPGEDAPAGMAGFPMRLPGVAGGSPGGGAAPGKSTWSGDVVASPVEIEIR